MFGCTTLCSLWCFIRALLLPNHDSLQSLVDFCKEPSLIVGLYRNYDCEVGSTNLFEDLCRFLGQGALPSKYEHSPFNAQC